VPHLAAVVANIAFLAIGVVLWIGVNRDARRVQERTGQQVWGLTNRTWAWIVAITFVGLVPYVVGRTITVRNAKRSPA
jgi:ABC-type amino acid transport system permease subunit